MDEIEQAVAAAFEDATEGFSIPPDDQVELVGSDVIDSLLWRRKRLLAERAEIVERFGRLFDQLRERLDLLTGERSEEVGRIESVVQCWHAARVITGGDLSVHLTGGTLRSTKAQPHWEITAEFTNWATKERPGLLRPPVPAAPQPDRIMVKKAFAIVGDRVIDRVSGEKVPGITVSEGGYLGRHYRIED